MAFRWILLSQPSWPPMAFMAFMAFLKVYQATSAVCRAYVSCKRKGTTLQRLKTNFKLGSTEKTKITRSPKERQNTKVSGCIFNCVLVDVHQGTTKGVPPCYGLRLDGTRRDMERHKAIFQVQFRPGIKCKRSE